MRNLKLEIEYDGTNYCGWQIQNSPQSTVHSPQKKAIQEVIEKTLQKILQEKIKLSVSGRTDAGVHAHAQVANFKSNTGLSTSKIQLALNSLLPKNIIIRRIQKVPLDFHSRFDAKSKLYCYTILNRSYSSVFLDKYTWWYFRPLDVNLMKKEARCLVGRHDFKSFRSSGSKEGSSIRTIYKLTVRRDIDFIYIHIRADGFLYNMVRNIAGTLVDIGSGKLKNMRKILLAKDRRRAGRTAVAKGLCLLKVYYGKRK